MYVASSFYVHNIGVYEAIWSGRAASRPVSGGSRGDRGSLFQRERVKKT